MRGRSRNPARFPAWFWGVLGAWTVLLIARPDWCFTAFRYAAASVYGLALLTGAR